MSQQALYLAWRIYRTSYNGPVNRRTFALALRKAWALTLASRRGVTVSKTKRALRPRSRRSFVHAVPFGPVSIG